MAITQPEIADFEKLGTWNLKLDDEVYEITTMMSRLSRRISPDGSLPMKAD